MQGDLRAVSELAFEVGWLKQSMKEAAERLPKGHPVAAYLMEQREKAGAEAKKNVAMRADRSSPTEAQDAG